jgi:hypothetical protein
MQTSQVHNPLKLANINSSIFVLWRVCKPLIPCRGPMMTQRSLRAQTFSTSLRPPLMRYTSSSPAGRPGKSSANTSRESLAQFIIPLDGTFVVYRTIHNVFTIAEWSTFSALSTHDLVVQLVFWIPHLWSVASMCGDTTESACSCKGGYHCSGA